MKKLFGTMAIASALALPGTVEAQSVAGAVLGYHTDAEAVGIGGYLSIAAPQLHENLAINPSFIWFFPDVGDLWELNADAVLRLPLEGQASLVPFALAGINIARASALGFSNTDVGLNLGGGLIFPLEGSNLRPVVGAKFEFQDATGFVIFGGVGIPVGG